LLFAFAVTLFFLPGTRGALLAFFLISPLFLYHCIQQFGVKRVIQRLKIPLVLSIILLLVVFLIMGKTADPIGRIFSLTQNDTNVHMRQEIFSTALSIFQKNKWFGTGLNTFSVEFLAEKEKLLETGIESDFQIHVPRVHNDLLQVLSELGIIGFLPILILLIILVSQIRYFREEGFIFLFIFLSSMVSFPFQMHVTALLAIATCARLSNQLQPVISCPIPPFQKYLISLILLGFSIFCLYLIPFRLASATATRLAGQNFNLGNLNATVLYKKALSWNPNNEFARFRLGIAEMDTGNYENAVTHFNQLHTRRNDPGVLYNKALSLFLLGDLENARQLFNRLLFISAKPDLVWMNLGNVLDKQAKYRQALRCFITSMELNPTEMTFLNLLRTAKKINIEKLLPFFAEKWSLIQSPTLRIRLIEVYRQHQMGDAADKLEKLFHGGNSGYLYSKRITKKNP
jgi:Tfp pilus assembly protein PilF